MAVSKSPAFQFYPKDWLSSSSVSVMTLEQQAAYFNLLCHEWVQEDCGLPTDEVELARLSRLGKKWPKCRDRILKQFVKNGDRFFNLRLLQEKEKQAEWRVKSSIGGKHGAAKRWANGNHQITTPILDSSPKDDIAVCSLQFALKEENISATSVAGTRWFNEQHERWYANYWCKRDKSTSRKAFEKRIKQLVATGKTYEESVEFLIERAQFDRLRFDGSSDWEFRGGLYPATWLKGERWTDEGPRTIIAAPKPHRQERRAGYPPCPSCGCNPCSPSCRAALALGG